MDPTEFVERHPQALMSDAEWDLFHSWGAETWEERRDLLQDIRFEAEYADPPPDDYPCLF